MITQGATVESLPTQPNFLTSPARVTGLAGDGLRAGAREISLAWQEARPVVQVMFQIRLLAGAALAAPHAGTVDGQRLLLGAAAWLCATWHVYLLNGMYDRVEDVANGSGRPLASGALPIDAARRIAVGTAGAALVLGAVVSARMCVLVAVMLALGWAYSAGHHPQKANLTGFVLVVCGGGLVTYLAGCEAANGSPGSGLAVFMLAMSLWMALAGMTKDLSDVAGDAKAGRRTLPIVLGDRAARWLMAVMALSVAGVLLTGAALTAGALMPVGCVLLVGAFLVAASTVLSGTRRVAAGSSSLDAGTATSPAAGVVDRDRQRRPYRVFMLTQYGVHLPVLGDLANLVVFA